MKLFRTSLLSIFLIPSIYSINAIAISTPDNPDIITAIGTKNKTIPFKETDNFESKSLQRLGVVQESYTVPSYGRHLTQDSEYIKLQISPAVSVLGEKYSFHRDSNGINIWKGTVITDTNSKNKNAFTDLQKKSSFALDQANYIELFVTTDGQLSGQVRVNGQLYGITSTDKNNIISFKIDESKFPSEDSPLTIEENDNSTSYYPTNNFSLLNVALPKRVSVSSPILDKNIKSDDISRINVLVVFTRDATEGMTAEQFSAAVSKLANTLQDSVNNSHVPILYKVTGISSDIVENGKSMYDLLADMRSEIPDNPIGNYVQKNRLRYRSDIVTLIAMSNHLCGLGEYIKNIDLSHGYNVVNKDCGLYNYTFPHEVGHNLGLTHNTEDASRYSIFAYGHGYRYPLQHIGDVMVGGWRTIMSYACPDHKCDMRINSYSSPNEFYQGVPMGTEENADNVRALQQTRHTAASVFPKPPATFERELLRNTQYGICLVSRNNKVRAKKCYTQDNNQYWALDEAGHLHNIATGSCLNISSGTGEGDKNVVNMVECDANPTTFIYSSQWLLQNKSDDQQVIEVMENGDVIVSPYEGGTQQQWIAVEPDKLPGSILRNKKTKTCMTNDGIYRIKMASCDQFDINQRWTLYDNGHLKNMGGDSSLCLNTYEFTSGYPLEFSPCQEHSLRYWAYNKETQNFNLVGDPRIIIGLSEQEQPIIVSSDKGEEPQNKWIFNTK
ncbi:MAG: ricin-type beta-trefoil lectin domain protein [Enterobacteriaceae bacterium]